MLTVHCILGRADAPDFAGRPMERLAVPAADAGRRRLRTRSERGEDVAIDLPSAAWLFDGAVLHDDGQRILVVVRPPEPVMAIDLANLTRQDVFRIGHALGNRHSPAEWREDVIVVSVTDTAALVARPLLALGIAALTLRFEHRPFAAEAAPSCAGSAHAHPPAQHAHAADGHAH